MVAQDEFVGTMLDGRYRITGLLGEGGMGQVYQGVQVALDRKVAIKVLHPRLAHEERFRERFIREARSASRIRHPNVVQILDFGDTPDGSVYFTMEFLEGRDLRVLLHKIGALSWERTRAILIQAVSALRAAHAKNIIHRDIKPGNCFLCEEPDTGRREVVKLLDFGIAKVEAEATRGDPHNQSLTGTGEIFGTASYMAPEQAYGAPLDARSDIYSLGIMAYEMLIGEVPFMGVNAIHVITRHLNDPPIPLREIDSSIAPSVEALVLKAIAKKPVDRFYSMAEFEHALLTIPASATAMGEIGVSGESWPRLSGGGSGSPKPPTGHPRAPDASTTEISRTNGSMAPPSPPLATPLVHQPTVMHEDPEARSTVAGIPGMTVVVPSRPGQRTHPPPGEIDVSTTRRSVLRSPATGPVSRYSSSPQVVETSPHTAPMLTRNAGPRRVALVLGVLAVLATGTISMVVVLGGRDSVTRARVESIERLEGEPRAMGPDRERSLDSPVGRTLLEVPVAVTEDVPVPGAEEDLIVLDDDEGIDAAMNAEAVEMQNEVESSPEELEVTIEDTPPPKRHRQARDSEPHTSTDDQVKAKIIRAIKRKCGREHNGANVEVEVTVGSNGSVLFKTINAPAGVKGCVSNVLSKAEFMPGTLRKLDVGIMLD